MSARAITGLPGTACALLALAVACGDAGTPVDPADGRTRDDATEAIEAVETSSPGAAATLDRQLAELRRTTARFHRIEEAQAAGYTVLVTHPSTGAACLEHPTDGGMGRHYLKVSLVDDQVSVTEPPKS